MTLRQKRLLGGSLAIAASAAWLWWTSLGHAGPRWHAMLAGAIGGLGFAVVTVGVLWKDR